LHLTAPSGGRSLVGNKERERHLRVNLGAERPSNSAADKQRTTRNFADVRDDTQGTRVVPCPTFRGIGSTRKSATHLANECTFPHLRSGARGKNLVDPGERVPRHSCRSYRTANPALASGAGERQRYERTGQAKATRSARGSFVGQIPACCTQTCLPVQASKLTKQMPRRRSPPHPEGGMRFTLGAPPGYLPEPFIKMSRALDAAFELDLQPRCGEFPHRVPTSAGARAALH